MYRRFVIVGFGMHGCVMGFHHSFFFFIRKFFEGIVFFILPFYSVANQPPTPPPAMEMDCSRLKSLKT